MRERIGSYENVEEILKRKKEDSEEGIRREEEEAFRRCKITPRSSKKGNGVRRVT